ncbi:hypothetical protein J1N35_013285 [Gossypium stocksii]|uniref:Uncharacterized protein n=1 Tax=Gossypium stocksii TaxID=47602 RepID=A0A9D4A872_9ROSI|nr:hypothetical protein J1N35_013285 [Gossypium stocksii]
MILNIFKTRALELLSGICVFLHIYGVVNVSTGYASASSVVQDQVFVRSLILNFGVFGRVYSCYKKSDCLEAISAIQDVYLRYQIQL